MRHQVPGWVSLGNCIMRLFSCSYSNVQTMGLEGKPEVREIKGTHWREMSFPHTLGTFGPQKSPVSDALWRSSSTPGLAPSALAHQQWPGVGCKTSLVLQAEAPEIVAPVLMERNLSFFSKRTTSFKWNVPLSKDRQTALNHQLIGSQPLRYPCWTRHSKHSREMLFC